MSNDRKQRAERKRQRFSDMGKASQRAQAARRMEGYNDRIREIAEIECENLPRKQGDAIGCLQWTDFRTGKVRRWTVKIGERADQITLHSPDGRSTGSHGWTWALNHLRGYLCGRSAGTTR